jgi:serine phosphatase RsbU (regulator of sigma subunit)
MYDKGTMKVIVLACVVIVFSVVLTGVSSYFITQGEVLEKLKTRDMVHIISAIASRIDGRLERAKEAALMLAEDPAVIEWVAGGERDEALGRHVKNKITKMAWNHDYSNAFVVSAVTGHYWAEGGRLIDVMSETDPDDIWFFESLKVTHPVELNIDSNKERGGTFVFVNALMRKQDKPLAVVGVGLSLQEIAQEFQRYKIGEKSNLWLADSLGKIHLAEDVDQIGLYLNDFVPPELSERIVAESGNVGVRPTVLEYVNRQGEMTDLVYLPMKSTDWKLVFQMPRAESIAILNNIRLHTILAGLISLVVIIFIFYFISARIANPLKRAILLGQELEKQVAARTLELEQKNQKIMDSIDYAQRLQESILPARSDLAAMFADFFVIWQPRDQVGGDFYWARRLDENRGLIAVIDCTGHGVPGAFMTMAVNSILDHITATVQDDPARILSELNRRVKETLHRSDPKGLSDDGLDIGLCYLELNRRIIFAGAKISLFVGRDGTMQLIRGTNKSLGYRRSSLELSFVNNEWLVEPSDVFYLTSDGFIDQNGGERDVPFGRQRFMATLGALQGQSLANQRENLSLRLQEYMGQELQRDDITVFGFAFLSGGIRDEQDQ